MSDELTQEFPNSVPDTEPTIMTLVERLRSMQELMDSRQQLADRRHVELQELADRRHVELQEFADRRHVELQELLFGVRDDVINRVEVLQTATDANFRKQEHRLQALNDSILSVRGDQRELFERVASLEEKAS